MLDDTILDLLPIGVCVYDRDGTIMRYNQGAAELWGRRPQAGTWPDGRPMLLEDCPVAQVLRTGLPMQDVGFVLHQACGVAVRVSSRIEPIRGAAGEMIGAVACFQSNGAPAAVPPALSQDNAAQLHALFKTWPAAIYTTDAAGRLTFYNDAAAELAGRRPELGRNAWCVAWPLFHTDGREMLPEATPVGRVLRQQCESSGIEAVAERPDGTRVSFIAHPMALHDATGAVIGAVNLLVDVSARDDAARNRALLVNELNHRVKNTLAAVQSIATHSFRDADVQTPLRWFESRLMALSQAHNVLTRQSWEYAELADIVAAALAPLRHSDGLRVAVSGAKVRLQPNVALSFAMAIHELATNAARYGALSNATGRVAVDWQVRAAGGTPSQLTFRWAESGGPPVRPPDQRGFGSRLLQRGLARELGAAVRLDYRPEGVVCTIQAPLP
jgi:PAS domain S-box-containing protein